jgi:DNA-binding NtrC family response regulator
MEPEKQTVEILVLDDEEIVCSRLKPALEKSGYVVETYTDSLKAKRRIEEHRFDIVITDLKMANIGGMELFRFAKEKWPDTEVIIISGFATVDITREALRSGARDIIPKPFKISHLKEIVDQIVDEITG